MITLAAWLHDLDPFLWRISGDFGLRWYGLSYVAGFVAAWALLRWLCARGTVQLAPDRALDAIIAMGLGAVIGGRLGYILIYEPALLGMIDGPPYWGVIALNRGGMASHGGLVGVIVAAWIIARGPRDEHGNRPERFPFLHLFDAVMMIAPPGLMFGRLANFINGELLGKIVAGPGETAPWWSVRYAQEFLERRQSELAQTPEQLQRLQAMALQRVLPDEFARLDLEESVKLGFGRVLRDIQSGSAEVIAQVEPLISARHPSQLYQAFAEGPVLMLAVWLVALKARRPGVVGACGLIVYGSLRIVTEFYRLPDAQLRVQQVLGLSRGQWMSAGMVACGLALLAWCAARNQGRIGGLLAPANQPTPQG